MGGVPLGEARLLDRAGSAIGGFLLWLCFVVLIAALPLSVPEVLTLAQTGHLEAIKIFPNGELLGPAYAISAAAIAQWLARRGRNEYGLLVKLLIGLNLVLTFVILASVSAYWLHLNNRLASNEWNTSALADGTFWILVTATALGLASQVAFSLSADALD